MSVADKKNSGSDEFAAARQQLEFIVMRLQAEELRHAEHGEVERFLH